MIKWTSGDILETTAKSIVVPVNLVGVMGAGLAKQVKDKWPASEKRYIEALADLQIDVGMIGITESSTGPALLWFPTKTDWKLPARLELIEAGLEDLVVVADDFDVAPVAVPRLGCGCGKLEWAKVKELMVEYLEPSPQEFYIYSEEDRAHN